MAKPPGKPQKRLAVRKIADLTDDQLRDWIDGCKAMESLANDADSLGAWRESREEAEAALAARGSPADQPVEA